MSEVDSVTYTFYPESLPAGLRPTSVHAVLVTSDGRVLLRWKCNEACMTGGHIEAGDIDWRAALRREALEEANVKIDRIDYLGYLEVREGDLLEYRLRAVARVSEILPAAPDPDRKGSWVYGRRLVPPVQAAAEYQKSMPAGSTREIIELAIRTAAEQGYFTAPLCKDYAEINPENRML